MTNQILYGIAVVPAIVGLVQVAKDMGLPAQFAPGLAVCFGLLAGVAEVFGAAWPVTQAIFVGIALGLSASGLYSGTGAIVAAVAGGGTAAGPNLTHLQDVSPTPPPAAQASTERTPLSPDRGRPYPVPPTAATSSPPGPDPRTS